ncbi:Ovule protein [Caenorhabditis elegans]|uniref:Ovule protein n=1 Tax=Caenorhabditis elegans TaxID=6239 RepID=Q21255_CAEEL|nr:Ovule protein [Caenorhabditis elegans]CAA94784.2 Ovule protein [Caenorhabditis elegans]|eukprot:NP_505446.2 Uncharacterized protein CELE_K06A4.6 [Caenorhabditis elegans]
MQTGRLRKKTRLRHQPTVMMKLRRQKLQSSHLQRLKKRSSRQPHHQLLLRLHNQTTKKNKSAHQ